MTKKEQAAADKAEAIERLRKGYRLKPGDEVYTSLGHVSRSGMQRKIKLFIARKGAIIDISYWAARAMGDRLTPQGIVIGGCGMDMGFALVYNLGRTLWPKGFKLAKNQRGRNGDKSERDEDGGYALTQRWM